MATMEYTDGFRRRMVERMTGPRAISATVLAAEVDVPQPTLSRWLRDASIVEAVKRSKRKARVKPAPTTERRPSEWTPEEKLQAVVDAAGLSEAELGGWLRSKGLREEDLANFRAAALAGMTPSKPTRKGESEEQKRIKALERDLKRSNAALAETAALLVLRKKAVALWGEEGEDT